MLPMEYKIAYLLATLQGTDLNINVLGARSMLFFLLIVIYGGGALIIHSG